MNFFGKNIYDEKNVSNKRKYQFNHLSNSPPCKRKIIRNISKKEKQDITSHQLLLKNYLYERQKEIIINRNDFIYQNYIKQNKPDCDKINSIICKDRAKLTQQHKEDLQKGENIFRNLFTYLKQRLI